MRRLYFATIAIAALLLLPLPASALEAEVYLLPDHILLQVGERGSYSSPFGSGDYTWASSDEAVAEVYSNGMVRAAGPGMATITATDGQNTASGVVFVRDYAPSLVTSLLLNESSLSLDRGESAQLSASTHPTHARNHTVYFISTDCDVATVDGSGRVTGQGKGHAMIYAYSADWSSWDGCSVAVGGVAGGGNPPDEGSQNGSDNQTDGGQGQSGWYFDQGIWVYYTEGKPVTGWLQLGAAWYYFDADGAMHTGWLEKGGDWYYMREDGVMQVGWHELGGEHYLFRPNGAMYTGWYYDWEHWYYLREPGNGRQGALAVGWCKVDGEWYYLHPAGQGKPLGSMATRWNTIDGWRYYFRYSGEMVTGWLYDGAEWYYFDPSGRFQYRTGQPLHS